MKILILGGIGEAKQLASEISGHVTNNKLNCTLILSIAGQVRVPEVACKIRIGGFGGERGLEQYLRSEKIDLMIDATHPYASTISRNADAASKYSNTPLWAYRRTAWAAVKGDQWTGVEPSELLGKMLEKYERPFFTIGRSALDYLQYKTTGHDWTIRYAVSPNEKIDLPQNGVTFIQDIGPFDIEKELELFTSNNFDVLITKNSGGSAVLAKIIVAKNMSLPVLMLSRPELPVIDQSFDDINKLKAALCDYISRVSQLAVTNE